MAIALLSARCILVCIFLRAGLAKISSPAEFRAAVANYRLLPPRLVPPVAAGLPYAEVAAAILLALGVFPGLVAAVLAALLAVFAAAIAINLARGREFDCGCAGPAPGGPRSVPQKISWRHVATNAVLALMAIAIVLAPPRSLALLPGIHGPFFVPESGTGALGVVIATVTCFAMAAVVRAAVTAHRLAADIGRH